MKKRKLGLVVATTLAAGALATAGAMQFTGGDSSPRPFVTPSATAPIFAGKHDHLKDESTTPEQVVEMQDQALKETSGSDEVFDPAGATFSQKGCVTREVSNQSSRNGARPAEFILHYTVSVNTDGWGDVNAIVSWFDNARSEASSNFVIDFEGHCAYIVSANAKAWTQGSYNPWAISIEFIANGSESSEAWKTKGLAGLKKGAAVAASQMKKWGIPVRYVNPSGCEVPAGLTDHNRLECGNTHTDVQPNFPYKKFLSLVKARLEPPKRCVKLQLLDDGKVLRNSPKFKPTEYVASLKGFQADKRGAMVDVLKNRDGNYAVRRAKVTC